ncbi:MAG: response regulator [Desulfobacterales bacterium]|nr:response regulator [Desulfobacterales bacterium]
MESFKDVSIRGKVLLIVFSALFFQVLIALTAIYFYTKAAENLAGIVDKEAEAIRIASQVNIFFREMVISEKNMIIDNGRNEETLYRQAFDDARRSLENSLAELRRISGFESTDEIGEFMASYQGYLTVHRDIEALSAGSKDEDAMRLSTGIGRDKRIEARSALTRLVDELDAALEQRKEHSRAAARTSVILIAGILAATLLVALTLGLWIAGAIKKGLKSLVAATGSIAGGNLQTPIETTSRDEIGVLASSVDRMQEVLCAARDEGRGRDWLKTGLARLNDVTRGDPDIDALASNVIREISEYLDAKIGAFYVMGESGEKQYLSLRGAYAYTRSRGYASRFAPGEGLVGQAAAQRKQILVAKVPDDYIKVVSGLGEAVPRHLCLTPLAIENRVKGVIEVGTLASLTDLQLEYLNQAAPALAVTLETVQGRDRLAEALDESRQLAEELQTQQEELKAANEELEEQTQRLQESEERLKSQQEELQVINEELEEKNEMLERQKKEVERASRAVGEKAEELALASTYKSEFLANMSHELRTPLNSLLLLAQGLARNKTGNLTEAQVESAQIIHRSGSDLLNLINEILDLSKIEAGQMTLHPGMIPVSDLADAVRASFRHMADEKGISLEVIEQERAPDKIRSDRKRVEQILRNLVSNAVKFTDEGAVTITFGRPAAGTDFSGCGLSEEDCLAVSVRDTGIGIAQDQQKIIFEAFQQADGGTARKYGGTGLGLSISREMAGLLGGDIQVQSEPGKGSTFILYLPIRGEIRQPAKHEDREKKEGPPPPPMHPAQSEAPFIADDSQSLAEGDTVVLVIEDDAPFARLLCEKCHEKGFKCLAALTGEKGLSLAVKHLPAAVILDIRLPGMDGWAVLSTLKEDTRTRHIPVHVVSVEEASTESLRRGAVGHAVKPLSQEQLEDTFRRLEQIATGRPKHVLVVEDDEKMRRETVKLIGNGDVKVKEAESGKQALEALRSGGFDCVVFGP